MKKFATVLVLVFCSLLTASPVFAQVQTPDPQPCKYPKKIDDYKLSENPIVTEAGEAPITHTYEFDSPATSPDKPYILQPFDFSFALDFSKLQAIFAPSNSDYLEGKFQDQNHQSQNISNLDSKGIDQYFGANEKLSPKILTDQLKLNYINYVSKNNHLPEAGNKITDIDSNNPKTIYDMVTQFKSDALKAAGEEQDPNTWGKYWTKIPTAWSESYKGYINFKAAVGQGDLDLIYKTKACVTPFYKINIVLPEYFRTTQVSEQTSRLMLPSSAQRDPKHEILAADFTGNLLADVVNLCKNLLAKTPTDLQKIVSRAFKISLNLLNPIKPVFADDSGLCIVKSNDPKAGQAPYCPLPLGEKERINGVDGMHADCPSTNSNDSQNLEGKNNQNVQCIFTLHWPGKSVVGDKEVPLLGIPNSYQVPGPDCTQTGDNSYHCKVVVRIWPVFHLPWTTEVWNNTTYGSGTGNKNPGVYSNFIPNSAIGNGQPIPGLDQPGKTQGASSDTDPKIRDLGTVNCAQRFTRDLALKPLALQQSLGINTQCQ